MHCAPWTLCVAGGLSLAILGGCYYPPRPMPTYSAPPGGVIVPPGQNGQFFQPGPTLTPQTVPGSPPQWQQPTTSPEGSWDPRANPNPVPDYGDPADLQPAPTFGPPSSRNEANPGSYNSGSIDSPGEVVVASAEEPGEFKPPMDVQPISASEEVFEDGNPQEAQTAPQETVVTAAATPSPYNYDREKYAWLRGTVQLDPEKKTWHIMYSAEPESSDPYGGDIELIVDPKLATFRDNDVVVVMGRVDPESPDSLGKPRYRVERALKVIPEHH
jgi:hypothetical protein